MFENNVSSEGGQESPQYSLNFLIQLQFFNFTVDFLFHIISYTIFLPKRMGRMENSPIIQFFLCIVKKNVRCYEKMWEGQTPVPLPSRSYDLHIRFQPCEQVSSKENVLNRKRYQLRTKKFRLNTGTYYIIGIFFVSYFYLFDVLILNYISILISYRLPR